MAYSNNDVISRSMAIMDSYNQRTPAELAREYSFDGFRQAAQASRKTAMKARSEYEAAIAALDAKIYAKGYLDSKRAEAKAELDSKIESLKTVLTKNLEVVRIAKKNALESFVAEAPTQAQINTLTVINMRGGKISNGELEMLIKSLGGNYQCLKALHDVAENSGLSFVMPIDVDEQSRLLESVLSQCEGFIEKVGSENLGYSEVEFYNYGNETPGRITAIFDKLDSDLSTAVVEQEKPLIVRMTDAAKVAEDKAQKLWAEGKHWDSVKESTKASELKNFIKDNGDVISGIDSQREALIEIGEAMIAEGK